MITLFILCVLYTFFGFRRFKKLYGTYDIFDEDAKLWTMLLFFTTTFSIIFGFFLIITYLP